MRRKLGGPSMHYGHRIAIAASALALAAPLPAAAQEKDPPRSAALKKLVDCRSIGDAAERLACFDREVAAVDSAEAANKLVVVDREQIRKTRRTLLGLALPDLGIFGGGDDEGEEEGASRHKSTIKSVTTSSYGRCLNKHANA